MELGSCQGRTESAPGIVGAINTPTRAGAGAGAVVCTPKREDGSMSKGRSWPDHMFRASPNDCSSRGSMKIGLGGDMLALIMAPGDVLFTGSCSNFYAEYDSPSSLALPGLSGCMTRPHTVSDWTDHILLVAGPPCSVWQNSPEASDLKDAWSVVRAVTQTAELWRVPAVSSSAPGGLYTAEFLLYVDRATGQLMLVGEIDPEDGELCTCERPEPIELWQSPAELRAQIRLAFVEEVLSDMKAGEARRNLISAACAIISQADMPGFDDVHTLDDVQACWKQDPNRACAVIAFWQRYLCKMAEACNPRGSAACAETAMALIRRWMPLRCDRALPGDLIGSMQSAGWILVSQIPRIFYPVLPGGQHTQQGPIRTWAGTQPKMKTLEQLNAEDYEPPERYVASERSREVSLEQLLPHAVEEQMQDPIAHAGSRHAENSHVKKAALSTHHCRPSSLLQAWMLSGSGECPGSPPPSDPPPDLLECSLRPRPRSSTLEGIIAL